MDLYPRRSVRPTPPDSPSPCSDPSYSSWVRTLPRVRSRHLNPTVSPDDSPPPRIFTRALRSGREVSVWDRNRQRRVVHTDNDIKFSLSRGVRNYAGAQRFRPPTRTGPGSPRPHQTIRPDRDAFFPEVRTWTRRHNVYSFTAPTRVHLFLNRSESHTWVKTGKGDGLVVTRLSGSLRLSLDANGTGRLPLRLDLDSHSLLLLFDGRSGFVVLSPLGQKLPSLLKVLRMLPVYVCSHRVPGPRSLVSVPRVVGGSTPVEERKRRRQVGGTRCPTTSTKPVSGKGTYQTQTLFHLPNRTSRHTSQTCTSFGCRTGPQLSSWTSLTARRGPSAKVLGPETLLDTKGPLDPRLSR